MNWAKRKIRSSLLLAASPLLHPRACAHGAARMARSALAKSAKVLIDGSYLLAVHITFTLDQSEEDATHRAE